MHAATRPAAVLAAIAALLAPSEARAQEVRTQAVAERGTVDRVTLYPRGAAVTRAVHRDLAQGLWELRVTDLPAGIDPRRLQAKVRTGDAAGDGAPRLLGVEYEELPGTEFAGSPEGIELAGKLRDAKRRLEHAGQDAAQLVRRGERLEQVGARAAANATNDGGTAKSDPAAALAQLAWVHDGRMKLLAEQRELAERTEAIQREVQALEQAIAQRGSAGRTQRSAVVRIAALEACAVDLDLTYHVEAAGWAPAYAVRAAGDRSSATVEYDAVIVQKTGEEWKDVRVALSTASPDRSAEPGEVQPVWVDVARPVPQPPIGRPRGGGAYGGGYGGASRKQAMRDGKPAGTAGEPGGEGGNDAEVAEALRELASEAAVSESGVAVNFELPRRVTVPSDAARRQRTRIAAFEPETRFTYVAEPLLEEDVYLRGDLVNASGFQLLAGPVDIHMGGDFVGTADMPAVAPKSPFKLFFGPDRAVRARREVVSRVTGAAGLFGGAVATTWKYRVTIENGTGRELRVELLDRRPESRNEKIEVKVADLSSPLSTDAEYAAGPQKTGILRWDLAVPATARGNAALPVTWTVQLTHPKDVQTTGLPD